MPYKILIVDDDEIVRRLLRNKFQSCGYEIAEAGDGREAIHLLEATDFDVVITDVLMPEQDGIELLMYLRREHPAIRAIAITAGDKLHLDNACGLGADYVFAKPFKLEALESAVKELLPA